MMKHFEKERERDEIEGVIETLYHFIRDSSESLIFFHLLDIINIVTKDVSYES